MPSILANYADDTFSFYDLTLVADSSDRRLDFHLPPRFLNKSPISLAAEFPQEFLPRLS